MEERVEVQEYIDFANAIVPESTEVISDLKSGEVWCELINLIDEGSISPEKIKKGKDLSDKDAKKNYKAIKKALSKKEVEYHKALDDELDIIISGDDKTNYELAKWFKEYFEDASHEDVRDKVKKDIEELLKDRDDDFPNAEIIFVDDDDEGGLKGDGEKDELIPTDEEVADEMIPDDDMDEEDKIVAGDQTGVDAAADEADAAEEDPTPVESGGEETPVDDPDVADEAPEEVVGGDEEIPADEQDADEAIAEVDIGAEEPPYPGEEVTETDLENPEEEPVVFSPEEIGGFEGEEEIYYEPTRAKGDSKNGLKQLALMVGFGAVVACLCGLTCYYRTRGCSSKAKSPVGGVKIKSDAGSSVKSTETSATGKAGDDALERMMEKLWDWFEQTPANKGYIVLEKKK